MTEEDKKLIADYMGWCLHENWDNSGEPFDTGACLNCGASIFEPISMIPSG